MTTVYISGPMSGLPEYNYPAFNEAAARLRALGYTVLNPAEGFHGNHDLPYDTYIRRDVESVLKCDMIALLDGWEGSAGSHLEVAIAVGIGVPVALLDDVIADGGSETIFAPHEGRETLARLFGLAKEEEPEAPESILEEAHYLVHGNRGADYGHPLDDFTKTALIWSAIFGVDVKPEQVALAMVGIKISRELNKPKRDNRVDGAGYFETLEMVVQEKHRREVTKEAP